MTEILTAVRPTPSAARAASLSAKLLMVFLLVLAVTYPDSGNLREKAAGLRAVGYPMLGFALPALWWLQWKDRVSFPWVADLMVTSTLFTDVLGNRLDLYDTVVWFDDWMHLMNTGLLAAAVVLLTLPATASRGAVLERALAFAGVAAILWEVGEYFAFISGSTERAFAYTDTLGDLALGLLGATLAALLVHALRAAGRLAEVEPVVSVDASRTGA